jgi:hypothetical protein
MSAFIRRTAHRIGLESSPNEWGPSGRVGFLERTVPKEGVGAEVGVHKGHFTPVLLEIARPSKLHIIDP